MKKRTKFGQIILELVIVFVGVFAAFWLNDYQNRKIELKKQKQIYQIIFNELDRFYIAGTEPDRFQNFTDLFLESEVYLDSLISVKKLPPIYRISGDYWRLDVLHSMYDSGKLADVEPELFRKLSVLKSNHTNFMDFIDEFNTYYRERITPVSDLDESELYTEDGQLKPKYRIITGYLASVNGYPKLLTSLAFEIKQEIKDKYLE